MRCTWDGEMGCFDAADDDFDSRLKSIWVLEDPKRKYERENVSFIEGEYFIYEWYALQMIHRQS